MIKNYFKNKSSDEIWFLRIQNILEKIQRDSEQRGVLLNYINAKVSEIETKLCEIEAKLERK